MCCVCVLFFFFVQDTVSADVVSSTEQILEQAEAADSKVTLNLYRNGRSLFDNINGMCSVFGGKIIMKKTMCQIFVL